MTKQKKVALVGLGPHARRIYYPYLVARGQKDPLIQIELVIDIESGREKVERFIEMQSIKPTKVVFLTQSPSNKDFFINIEYLEALLRNHGITHVIIATEPKAHKEYLKLCIKLGLKVLTDKPITTPLNLMPSPSFTKEEESQEPAREISRDHEELLALLDENPEASVTVQTQRRYHKGYQRVIQELSRVVREYRVPITYIDVYHSDGMWNMPLEVYSRENHPYKYGYGKLMHSGYHFVDLLQNFLRINEILDDKLPDKASIFSQSLRPMDHQASITPQDYQHFFGGNLDSFQLPPIPNTSDDTTTYGELDSYSQWQFSRQGRVMTTVQMALLQSGFSLRGWDHLPEDTYKANGRVRHERINIHVGPLLNIQVHSYQAVEIADSHIVPDGVGAKNHFDIFIFRNTNLIGGQPFELIRYGDSENREDSGIIYLGQNEQPRFTALDEFFSDAKLSSSDLRDHLTTNKLMSVLYSNQAKQNYGHIPYTELNYREIF